MPRAQSILGIPDRLLHRPSWVYVAMQELWVGIHHKKPFAKPAVMDVCRVVVCSGYMSPPHRGHVEYIRRSKELAGDTGKLIVILNSDAQAVQKHGFSFMPIQDRAAIIGGLKWVDEVVVAVDRDRTVRETLTLLAARPVGERPTHFTNAGDQTNDSIPEAAVCREHGIALVDGLGDKVQSSRWLISAALEAAAAVKAQTLPSQPLEI